MGVSVQYLIIGGGAAGASAAGRIRQLDPQGTITILSAERHPYYARPRLPEVIRGSLDPEALAVFKPDWYSSRHITLGLGETVTAIDCAAGRVVTGSGEYRYEKLLLATGADPFFPPIAGLRESGAFALRTVEDALRIRECAASCRTVLVLGGGLLGLELADHLADGRREIRVVEYFDTLLPRQLAPEKGRRLQQLLEARGFRFFLGEHSTRLDRVGEELVLVTESGDEIRAGMAIVSAGVRAATGLAAAAGIPTDKGILVNHYLETGVSGIHAAGDCLELDGRLWGFVKSAMEQGRIAGENMVRGNAVAYADTEMEIKLKVSDIDLAAL